MSFNLSNLTFDPILFGGNDSRSPLVWDYNAGSDNISAVEAANYFAGGVKALRQGDVVRVTANDGNALYIMSSVTINPGSEAASVSKLAAGVSSFP